MTLEDIITGLPAPKPLRLSDSALFLDLDGTLAPIAARPQDVRPDPRRSQLVSRLESALGDRLAVVSGRTLGDVDRILENQVVAVAAVHGLVRREPDGVVSQIEPHPGLPLAADRFRAFAARDSGLIVEEKGGLSIALHYRLARAQAEAARACAEEIAGETGLILQHGDMVEELRTPGPDKGDSVRAFLDQPPFKGAQPVFLGDDATDEHAFEAVQALGGISILVGPMRDTHARFRLGGVDQVLTWLEAAL
ncbi:MAG: trehalose-phosphatase [Phenylobacterium sp.]